MAHRLVVVSILCLLGATGALGVRADEDRNGASGGHAADPGPRPNPASVVPHPVPGLSQNEQALFFESLLRVSELEGTCDTCSQQAQNQLPIDPDPEQSLLPPRARQLSRHGAGVQFRSRASAATCSRRSAAAHPRSIRHRSSPIAWAARTSCRPSRIRRAHSAKPGSSTARAVSVTAACTACSPCRDVRMPRTAAAAARLPDRARAPQRRLPHSAAAVRPRADRVHPGQGDHRQHEFAA